jgi:catechol 2,3-dioxygenase-like lactoylglutathione lyase family enzyme
MSSTSLVSGVDFVFLPSKNFAQAADFYENVLGLSCSARYKKAPGGEFETGNLTIQILETEAIGIEFNAARNPIALHVDDVAAARAALESRGVSFEGDILDSGVCHMTFFNDPDGNALMIHHRYAPRDS